MQKKNEYSAERNKYGEIVDFVKYDVDTKQNIYSAGFRFTDKIYLGTFYQQFQYKDNLKKFDNYNINQLLIIYNMTF